MSSVISVENLSKKYTLQHRQQELYPSLKEVLTEGIKKSVKHFSAIFSPSIKSQPSQQSEDFWALRDVFFEVKQGDRIGIIGRNGAGKSTLLKILSRITEPTTGSVSIMGRVASLLEVGTGFHPDLTGRENIYLNGAILGMSRFEIKKRFDEIVDFAEIEKFLDTPVKRYSSGMYVRLAFAVAAHLEPEIMIVDEVLAVGDAQFQKKCLGKMEDVSAKEGRTVVFVSHNLAAIKSLCNRSILINQGRIIADDTSSSVIKKYTDVSGGNRSVFEQSWPDENSAPKNSSAILVSARILYENGDIAHVIDTDTTFYIELEYRVMSEKAFVGLTILITDSENVLVLSSINNRDPEWHGSVMPPGIFRSRCRIPSFLLNNGCYSISLNLFGANFTDLVNVNNLLSIEILDSQTLRGDFFGVWGGVVRPDLKWMTSQVHDCI